MWSSFGRTIVGGKLRKFSWIMVGGKFLIETAYSCTERMDYSHLFFDDDDDDDDSASRSLCRPASK